MICHQGRQSTDSVNAYIRGRAAWNSGGTILLDTVDPAASFRNIHYPGSSSNAVRQRGKGWLSVYGKMYDAKFAHVEGYDTCITCHDPHSLELKYDKCATCHTGATDTAALKNIRMKGSLEDYDGDGNLSEGMY